MFEDDSDRQYRPVRNHESQYSLWPADSPPPRGWVVAGPEGSKAECLAYVSRVWTDMRPLSARRAVNS
ncbi:MbtH family protein [Allorhizocola rhizosphaerae]|uniref:MbtH family protein n=1 Tax=Allorhizocola rhizosphaerae TaxID=1872709 RepID=UPI000E3E5C26|nr:MbtH family protein [Allorhizocola rhizosphaerae]